MIEKKVFVENLKPGMYVSRLDRPWTQTNFKFQGLKLESGLEIAQIRRVCEHVFVDIERCNYPASYFDRLLLQRPTAPSEFKVVPISHELPVEDELSTASTLQQEIASELKSVIQDIGSGQPLKAAVLQKQVVGLVNSVMRNTDASLLLTLLQEKDDYSYRHAINCAILATAFGRKLGFKPDQLRELALGCLLFDVGKAKLPQSLLNKQGELSEGEYIVIKHHVDFGLNMIAHSDVASPTVLAITRHHHERYDGSGYPDRLAAGSIPVAARIAGLVDTYDAMLSHRSFKKALSHEDIISELYRKRNQDFQSELLEHFIKFLGIYPTGSLVELNNGKVAVVLSQNETRRMQPRIMVILDAQKRPQSDCPVIDLLTEDTQPDGEPLKISQLLVNNAYGINPADYYMKPSNPA